MRKGGGSNKETCKLAMTSELQLLWTSSYSHAVSTTL
jgi:hypothetical protein